MPVSAASVDPDADAADGASRVARVLDLDARRARRDGSPRIVLQASVDERAERDALRAGLLATPARTSPKFLYDPVGAALFSAICTTDEYYPTRTEAAIFAAHRRAIADALPRDSQWIDLGCGDGLKSRGWLEPARVRRYVGVDIAPDWLRDTLVALQAEQRARSGHRPALDVLGVVTDFTRSFDLTTLIDEAPSLPPVFFYPGSSIGNFAPDDAREFLRTVRAHLARGDRRGRLLIGADLVKDEATLVAAYDDALGVTAAFDRNVLRVANRLLDADFDPAAFAHRAVWDAAHARIEMQLVARRAHDVRIGDVVRRFDEDETIVTEHSHKYTVDGFAALLASAGFAGGDRIRCWTDPRRWFGVFVAEAA